MLSPSMDLLAQAATQHSGLLTTVGLVLLGVIVVAFLAFGMHDLSRLSWARISAISSVSSPSGSIKIWWRSFSANLTTLSSIDGQ